MQGHKKHHPSAEHHKMMMKDFKKRFVVSTALTIPILLLSPLIQRFLGFTFAFAGDRYVLFALSAIVYFYGGKPFLLGMRDELRKRTPGMMTLIALAITVAFFYSAAVTFGLPGKTFYWELATLIDIMLLGHYIEMRSVLGASRALEELIKLMPTEAHLITPEGIKEVPVSDLRKGDIVLIKPGEKIPSDGIVIEGETSVNEAMLTGDNSKVAKWVAEELNLDGYFAEVLPHQKSMKIKELQEKGSIVAMVGDGINDAPALIQADVGIAIGAGADVAIESADIVLIKNDPRDVITAIHLARATYRKMVENLAWATGYNALAIPLAAGYSLWLWNLTKPGCRCSANESEYGNSCGKREVSKDLVPS